MKRLAQRTNIILTLLAIVSVPLFRPAVALASYNPAPWTGLVPTAPIGYSPTTSDICHDGSITCVDNTISQLHNQLATEMATCDHKAAFTLTYQRITEAYRATAVTPGYYQNTPYVNQMDAVFASYFFNQKSAWANHDLANVGDAWKIAFDAADNKKTTALGDLFLAVNAHIVADEASVLDQMGLTYANGSTAKVDYDHDNEWLFQAQGTTISEIARRLDPTITQPVNINMPPVDTLSYQLIALWRQQAWNFAEQFKVAESLPPVLGQPMYSAIRAAINTEAVANANLIKAATLASPAQVTARDTYCAAHRYDP